MVRTVCIIILTNVSTTNLLYLLLYLCVFPCKSVQNVQSEEFTAMDPFVYAYTEELGLLDRPSLPSCASVCDVDNSCVGFYYGKDDTSCRLGSRLVRYPTSSVPPGTVRMYRKKSYALRSHCPSNFRWIQVSSQFFCVLAVSNSRGYFAAQTYCTNKGASLLYLDGIESYLSSMKEILDKAGADFKSFWGGAHQISTSNSNWMWDYTRLEMSQAEYNSISWTTGSSGHQQKCLQLDVNSNKAIQLECSDAEQFVCEIVLL